MDTSSVLWTNWQEQLKELLTGMHGHQKKTLAFFVLGIVLSGCAVMQRVAETGSRARPQRGQDDQYRAALGTFHWKFAHRGAVDLEALFGASFDAVSWAAVALRAGQHALSGRFDHCVSGTAGAFAGVACRLGGDASSDKMG